MKVCSYQAKKNSKPLQEINIGLVVAKIKGSVKALGQQYQNATVLLFNKANLQPIAVHRPDRNGDYSFLSLNKDLKTFVVAFDQNQQYNAVIQDNVVPK